MATALQGFRLSARRCTCWQPAQRCAAGVIGGRRALSTTPSPWEQKQPDAFVRAREKLGEDVGKAFEEQGIVKPEEWQAVQNAHLMHSIENKFRDTHPPPRPPAPRGKLKETFMNLEDPEPWEEEGNLEDDFDDMPTLAYGELELHRERRHYARLAAWEMPLLAKLAKPFQPPSADMMLRFRYTTYMGEQHPAEKKVVVEFATADLPDLTPVQREKLKKLVGPRYNPDTDIVRMNCEMFETQAQNKRYLGDLVESLLREARTGDTFEDVPLDLRHHRSKPKPKFPKEWAMTEERQKQLAGHRHQLALKDERREMAGELVDGVRLIEEFFARPPPVREALPEQVTVAARARGKKVAVRR